MNALEGDMDRFKERTYSNKEDSSDGILVHNEFEISEEPNDLHWSSIAIEAHKNEFFPPRPNDLPRTQIERTTPPPSPFKIIKQTFYPHNSENSEISNIVSNKTNESIPLLTRDPLALIRRPPPTNLTTTVLSAIPPRSLIKAREAHIRKLLLFNAYPVADIILWIPGILNRFIELTGHKSRTVAILQASTQFVGLANACK
jgi:hypothetical protein